jgi:uncharacterized protein with HEPN domain
MRDEDRARLGHMIEHAELLASFIKGRQRQDLDNDAMLELACIRAIEVIGEAASQISTATRAAYPDIPWRSIIGMRNRLIHAYLAINRDVVWRTAIEEVPTLLTRLRAIPDPPGP